MATDLHDILDAPVSKGTGPTPPALMRDFWRYAADA